MRETLTPGNPDADKNPEKTPGPMLVTISGPRGAGKGTVLDAMRSAFPDMKKLVTYTTRAPRPGEVDGDAYHFVDEMTFQKMVDDGTLAWSVNIGPTQRSGPAKASVAASGVQIADIASFGARRLKKQVEAMGGKTLMIAIVAPERIRKPRILARDPNLSEARAQQLIEDDLETEDLDEYRDYDVILRNHGNETSQVTRQAIKAVEKFLGSKEDISDAKKALLRLEREGKYVFHGSGVDLALIEPRQATDDVRGLDGPPSVFASTHAEHAIFFAIVNTTNCPEEKRSEAGTTTHDDGTITFNFGASKDTLDQLKDDSSGWVYVLDKSAFTVTPQQLVEHTVQVPIAPLHKIRVTKRDLPKNIEVI